MQVSPPPVASSPRGRVPPQDLEAERAVLGSILLDNEAAYVAIELLQADDFYRPAHAQVFTAVVELTTRSEPIDVVTLSSALSAKGQLEGIGGLAALVGLSESVPTSANIKHYGELVRKKAMLRRLIAAATQIVRDAYDSPNPEEQVDVAEKMIFDIAKDKARQGITPISEIVATAFKLIEKLAEEKRAITGVGTGIFGLDKLTAGLQPSDLIIVAGRPSMGKTAFSLGIALHAATSAGAKVGALLAGDVEGEPGPAHALQRRAHRLGPPARRLPERGGLAQARPRRGSPLGGAGLDRRQRLDLRARGPGQVPAARGRARPRPGDDRLPPAHARQPEHPEPRAGDLARSRVGSRRWPRSCGSRWSRSRQLNRSVEQRVDKRPVLADLRESGAIEQDADVIMFVYRDEVYHPETEDRGIAEIIIGKQRNGPIGTVRCRFFHEYTRFDNLLDDERGGR